MVNWDNEIEKLKDYVFTQKLSYEEIGRIYNCTGNNIKKVMQIVSNHYNVTIDDLKGKKRNSNIKLANAIKHPNTICLILLFFIIKFIPHSSYCGN